ncbi:hypothetical protein D9M70_131960 [compost metagenome]
MKQNKLWAAVLVGCLTLAGCKEATSNPATAATAPEPPVQRNLIGVPALPVIQDAVLSLSPTFAGKRNVAVMGQLCALARGETDQARVNEFLRGQGIDAAKVPLQGDPLSLLVNGDRSGQTTACAAYLATSVLTEVDAGEFMRSVQVPLQEEAKPVQPAPRTTKKDGKPKEQPALAAQPKTRTVLQVDDALLAEVLPIKLAEARADADVFALIAAELQRRPGLSVPEYRDEARQLFSRLAPVYLERIKTSLPPANTTYKLVRLDTDAFVFTNSRGSRFEYTSDGLRLWQNGILWYGEGQLLGQEYQLQATYFPEAVNGLLAPLKQ